MKTISRIRQKDVFLGLLFVLSFFNIFLLMGLYVYIAILAFRNIQDTLKGLLVISFRTIINPSIAIDVSSLQMLKWVVLFMLSFLAIYESKSRSKPRQICSAVMGISGFCVYIMIISVFNSSYPLVSIFKCFSYGFVFCSILLGVGGTADEIDWIEELYNLLSMLMISSIIFAPFNFSYYSSARWFMGMTNQSQMFGIMAALYSAILLYRMIQGKRGMFLYAMLLLILFLTFLTGSRTGLIATLICLIYGLYVEVVKNKRTILFLGAIVLCLVLVLFFSERLVSLAKTFLLKNPFNNSVLSLGNITASRQGQFEQFIHKYQNNKAFGSGFMVPFIPNYQDWSMSFSLIVESGNLVYELLGDLGIIGTILFVIAYGNIFVKAPKQRGNFVLFLAPFLVCMGEMIFYSTNNNAIILYFMFAAFLCGRRNQDTSGSWR